MMRTRLLILGVFAALIGVYVLVSGPVSARQAEMRQELADKHKVLMDFERFVDHRDEANAELESLKEDVADAESYLLTDSGSTSALSKLQMEIQDLAGSAGLTITSIRPLHARDSEGYRRLSMQVEARGNIIQVGTFLKKLDTLKMLIGMEDLSLVFAADDQLKMKSVMNALAMREGDNS